MRKLKKTDNQGAQRSRSAQRDNEIYTVNGKAFDYVIHPISIQAEEPYRIYLVNMLRI